jgi:hypothetical protein
MENIVTQILHKLENHTITSIYLIAPIDFQGTIDKSMYQKDNQRFIDYRVYDFCQLIKNNTPAINTKLDEYKLSISQVIDYALMGADELNSSIYADSIVYAEQGEYELYVAISDDLIEILLALNLVEQDEFRHEFAT